MDNGKSLLDVIDDTSDFFGSQNDSSGMFNWADEFLGDNEMELPGRVAKESGNLATNSPSNILLTSSQYAATSSLSAPSVSIATPFLQSSSVNVAEQQATVMPTLIGQSVVNPLQNMAGQSGLSTSVVQQGGQQYILKTASGNQIQLTQAQLQQHLLQQQQNSGQSSSAQSSVTMMNRSVTPNSGGLSAVSLGLNSSQFKSASPGPNVNIVHLPGNLQTGNIQASSQQQQTQQTQQFQIAPGTFLQIPGGGTQNLSGTSIVQGQQILSGQSGALMNSQNTVIQNPNVVNVNVATHQAVLCNSPAQQQQQPRLATQNPFNIQGTLIQTAEGKSILIPSQNFAQPINIQQLSMTQPVGQTQTQNPVGNMIQLGQQQTNSGSDNSQNQGVQQIVLNNQGQQILVQRAPTPGVQPQNILVRTTTGQQGLVQIQRGGQLQTAGQTIQGLGTSGTSPQLKIIQQPGQSQTGVPMINIGGQNISLQQLGNIQGLQVVQQQQNQQQNTSQGHGQVIQQGQGQITIQQQGHSSQGQMSVQPQVALNNTSSQFVQQGRSTTPGSQGQISQGQIPQGQMTFQHGQGRITVQQNNSVAMSMQQQLGRSSIQNVQTPQMATNPQNRGAPVTLQTIQTSQASVETARNTQAQILLQQIQRSLRASRQNNETTTSVNSSQSAPNVNVMLVKQEIKQENRSNMQFSDCASSNRNQNQLLFQNGAIKKEPDLIETLVKQEVPSSVITASDCSQVTSTVSQSTPMSLFMISNSNSSSSTGLKMSNSSLASASSVGVNALTPTLGSLTNVSSSNVNQSMSQLSSGAHLGNINSVSSLITNPSMGQVKSGINIGNLNSLSSLTSSPSIGQVKSEPNIGNMNSGSSLMTNSSISQVNTGSSVGNVSSSNTSPLVGGQVKTGATVQTIQLPPELQQQFHRVNHEIKKVHAATTLTTEQKQLKLAQLQVFQKKILLKGRVLATTKAEPHQIQQGLAALSQSGFGTTLSQSSSMASSSNTSAHQTPASSGVISSQMPSNTTVKDLLKSMSSSHESGKTNTVDQMKSVPLSSAQSMTFSHQQLPSNSHSMGPGGFSFMNSSTPSSQAISALLTTPTPSQATPTITSTNQISDTSSSSSANHVEQATPPTLRGAPQGNQENTASNPDVAVPTQIKVKLVEPGSGKTSLIAFETAGFQDQDVPRFSLASIHVTLKWLLQTMTKLFENNMVPGQTACIRRLIWNHVVLKCYKIANKVLTLSLTQAQRDKVQSYLDKMTPEQQQQYLQTQQGVLQRIQKQQELNAQVRAQMLAQKKQQALQSNQSTSGPATSASTSTKVPESSTIKTEVKSIPVPTTTSQSNKPSTDSILSRNLLRGQKRNYMDIPKGTLINQQIKQDQNHASNPDTRRPFKSRGDACRRLLRYHVFQSYGPSEEEFTKFDGVMSDIATDLLQKKDSMFDRFRVLLLQETMCCEPSSELVMLQRMQNQDLRKIIEEEKEMVKNDPESFVPMPSKYLRKSNKTDKSMDEDDSSGSEDMDTTLVKSDSANSDLDDSKKVKKLVIKTDGDQYRSLFKRRSLDAMEVSRSKINVTDRLNVGGDEASLGESTPQNVYDGTDDKDVTDSDQFRSIHEEAEQAALLISSAEESQDSQCDDDDDVYTRFVSKSQTLHNPSSRVVDNEGDVEMTSESVYYEASPSVTVNSSRQSVGSYNSLSRLSSVDESRKYIPSHSPVSNASSDNDVLIEESQDPLKLGNMDKFNMYQPITESLTDSEENSHYSADNAEQNSIIIDDDDRHVDRRKVKSRWKSNIHNNKTVEEDNSDQESDQEVKAQMESAINSILSLGQGDFNQSADVHVFTNTNPQTFDYNAATNYGLPNADITPTNVQGLSELNPYVIEGDNDNNDLDMAVNSILM